MQERQIRDGLPVVQFAVADDFAAWLDEHHAAASGVWVKIAKKGRGMPSIGFHEPLEVSMRYGWVDSKMHRLDDDFYILRYQPRGPRSTWGPRNRRLAQQLSPTAACTPPVSPRWPPARPTAGGGTTIDALNQMPARPAGESISDTLAAGGQTAASARSGADWGRQRLPAVTPVRRGPSQAQCWPR